MSEKRYTMTAVTADDDYTGGESFTESEAREVVKRVIRDGGLYTGSDDAIASFIPWHSVKLIEFAPVESTDGEAVTKT